MGRGKFLRSLRQRWWILALLVLPATIGTLLYSVTRKPQYEGFMQIADRRERDLNQPDLFTSQMLGGGVNDQEIRVTNLANTVTSYTVLKTTFDYLVQNGTLKEKTPEAEREFIARVDVKPLRGSEYIRVSYVGDDYEETQTVIEALRDKFLDRYRKLFSEEGQRSVAFIESQLKEQEAIYDDLLQKLKEFKEKYPQATAYEQNTSGLVGNLQAARLRLAKADESYASAYATYVVGKRQENSPLLATEMTTQRSINPVYAQIEERIKGTEATLESQRERYGENHPTIVQLKQQLETDRASLAHLEAIGEKYLTSTIEPNFSRNESDRRQAVLSAERALNAARMERAAAQAEYNRLRAQLEELPVVEKELAKYSAQISAQAQSVANLKGKLEEARVRAAQSEAKGVLFLDQTYVIELDRGTILKTLIAFFLSMVVAVSLIASLGQFDQSTYTATEAENSLGFPVIAALPRSGQQRLNPDVEQPTPLAASYQILSTQLMGLKDRLTGPGILVASAEPNSGRSTVAANMAISLARDGARVLLVDGDLRSPSLHDHFGLQNRAGLAEILNGEATIEDVVQPTGVEGLLFIAGGQPPVNPIRLFNTEAMKNFVEQISKGADFIVIDSPAGGTFGDATVLAEHVQNVVLIHEAGRAPSEAEFEFHRGLERVGVNVVGLVLNKTRPEDCPAYQSFRRNYQATISRYHAPSARAALGPGGQPPVREQTPPSSGSKEEEDE